MSHGTRNSALAARDPDPDHHSALRLSRGLGGPRRLSGRALTAPSTPRKLPRTGDFRAVLREGRGDTDAQNFVEYACADRIATITLNRPEKLNAVSDEVVRQLAEAFRRFD